MDKHQAEIVAEALLEPARREQIETAAKLKEQRRRSVEKSRQVMFGFAGAAAGAATGYFTGGPVSLYCGVGSGIAVLVGFLATRLGNNKDA
jgi:hypothetical protein